MVSYLFIDLICFETHSHYIAPTGLKISGIYPLSTGIKGMHQHTQPKWLLTSLFYFCILTDIFPKARMAVMKNGGSS